MRFVEQSKVALPGDTRTGCRASLPLPHCRFPSPPRCGRMTSAAGPRSCSPRFWAEDCVPVTPVGERTACRAQKEGTTATCDTQNVRVAFWSCVLCRLIPWKTPVSVGPRVQSARAMQMSSLQIECWHHLPPAACKYHTFKFSRAEL